jgi:ABC-2 type transport system permease protein
VSVAARSEATAVLGARESLPGARAAVGVELAKLREQLAIRVVLAVCLLGPLGFALLMRLQSAVPADTLFGRWARTSGFATSLTVLGFAGSWGLPLLAGIVAGDAFAGEDRHGTWKTLLTRSCTRAEIFVGKAVSAATAAVLALVLLAASSVIAGLVLVSSDPLVGLSGQLVPRGRAAELVLASWTYTLLPTLAYVALALLLSVATRSGIAGVLGPAVVGLVMQLLSLLGSGEIVRALLLSTPFDAWHGLFTEPAHGSTVAQGATTSIAYTVVFLEAAWLLFRRRAFAGAEAVAHRRWRAPVRAAVAAAALVALLAFASNRGPTAITGDRLEAAITPTFQRLVELQYRWRTGQAPQRAVRVLTACRRGGGARAPRGPGDDWACAVVVHGARGAWLNLEVTLRANGCYTAQAPPTIIGQQVLRNAKGRAFLNPAYAFDGCFGTP